MLSLLDNKNNSSDSFFLDKETIINSDPENIKTEISNGNMKFDEIYSHLNTLDLLLKDFPASLINSLRRIMISEIPNIAFSNEFKPNIENNSINILDNQSSLHNEFVAHRVSLIPICTYAVGIGRCNIISTFNVKNGKRTERFLSGNKGIPHFKLLVVNDKNTRECYKSGKTSDELQVDNNKLRPNDYSKDSGIIKVSSKDFELENALPNEHITDFIRPDIVSWCSRPENNTLKFIPENFNYNDYCILNKLKPDINGVTGEKLELECHLTIGNGYVNSNYSPVGTVIYKFIQEKQEILNVMETKYIENLQKERTDKGLSMFDAGEVENIKTSYRLLDSKRVYRTNENGEANLIQLTIESVGNMLPCQIYYYSIHLLSWKLMDILTSYTLNMDLNSPYHNDKVIFRNSTTKMDGFEIFIKNENHTLGNLLSYYLQSMYQLIPNKIFDFVAYSQPHPLEKNIVIKIKLSKHFSIDKFYNWLVTENIINIDDISKLDINVKQHYVIMFLFNQTIFNILSKLDSMSSNSKEILNIILPMVKDKLNLSHLPNMNFLRFISHDCDIKYFPNNFGDSYNKNDYLYLDIDNNHTNIMDNFLN